MSYRLPLDKTKARVLKVKREEPEISTRALSERFRLPRETIQTWLKAAGLASKPVPGGWMPGTAQ